MSVLRERDREAFIIANYNHRLAYWRSCEPPKWRLIKRYLWKKWKPKRT